MKTLFAAGAGLVAALAFSGPTLAADAAHGQTVFRAQCGVCHMAADGDGEGSQGPNLKGVMGRKVGGDPDFAYSPGLMDAKSPWTEISLDAFLANPQTAYPGTAMPINMRSAEDRADVVAYLATVKAAK